MLYSVWVRGELNPRPYGRESKALNYIPTPGYLLIQFFTKTIEMSLSLVLLVFADKIGLEWERSFGQFTELDFVPS